MEFRIKEKINGYGNSKFIVERKHYFLWIIPYWEELIYQNYCPTIEAALKEIKRYKNKKEFLKNSKIVKTKIHKI